MRLLLLDTCGETGLIALSDGDKLLAESTLPARDASRTLLNAIAEALTNAGWKLSELDAVCVVAGPGSFTGVRVGMAATKGLCEPSGLRLVSLSRLAVLANAADGDACAVLDAGRGEYYVRTKDGREVLARRDQIAEIAAGVPMMVCEQKVSEALSEFDPQLCEMTLVYALPLARAAMNAVPQDAALADTNYVRREQDIYPKARP